MNTETTPAKQNGEESVQTERTRSGRVFRPNVDILEQAGELVVLADLPGLKPEDIDIKFEDGELVIHGKTPQRQADGTGFLLQEYDVGDYYRSFRVSEDINAEGISAQYTNGVLELTLPKAEAVKPRRIAVQAG